ncbi:MAG TPA: GIY-YIG nuclease family protein [Candidatus Babeliales bacterium]|nr:GIY-YIG nuclease family protein [Candidatus Babeliales bacterium]
MNPMHYVYIIKSKQDPSRIYVGCTQNLNKRLSDHNSGTTTHTAKYMPWELAIYIGFENKDKAIEFEQYLKSGSGREFRKKRLC